jgi:hypothetical protein
VINAVAAESLPRDRQETRERKLQFHWWLIDAGMKEPEEAKSKKRCARSGNNCRRLTKAVVA